MHDRPDPLIVTACMDEIAAARFEALRRAHFPPRLNLIQAHLTLFHKLPGEGAAAVAATLVGLCADVAPFPFAVAGLRLLGRGVAAEIDAPALGQLRQRLAAAWEPWLSAQDRQGFRPHVTLQNKTDAETARRLAARLAPEAPTWGGTISGLALWTYRGGPWEAAGAFPFRS